MLHCDALLSGTTFNTRRFVHLQMNWLAAGSQVRCVHVVSLAIQMGARLSLESGSEWPLFAFDSPAKVAQ